MKSVLDWDSIVETHAERVYRIAFRILGSVHDAEDVSQTVFIEAMKLNEKGPVQTWTGLLVRLATLRSIDLLRRRRNEQQVQDYVQVTNAGPDEKAVAAELAQWLRNAVSQLPDQQCAVFTLSHFEQMDRSDVAASLGISPESVSTSLYKAKQQLLSQLNVLNGGIR